MLFFAVHAVLSLSWFPPFSVIDGVLWFEFLGKKLKIVFVPLTLCDKNKHRTWIQHKSKFSVMEYVIFKFITGNENWENIEHGCIRQQIIDKNVGEIWCVLPAGISVCEMVLFNNFQTFRHKLLKMWCFWVLN